MGYLLLVNGVLRGVCFLALAGGICPRECSITHRLRSIIPIFLSLSDIKNPYPNRLPQDPPPPLHSHSFLLPSLLISSTSLSNALPFILSSPASTLHSSTPSPAQKPLSSVLCGLYRGPNSPISPGALNSISARPNFSFEFSTGRHRSGFTAQQVGQ
ncbi:hypothetical protein B9Z19DRAFT_1077369 [Tuber borchii]|uniref:Uncharacterized protein n=1 Tax=Tuber borchii TaxID=42251 RepID=A0A2T7A0X0_TUBBO|nr:hypothetical protein B9Z19DRAFT_1077369 [Tuber borchii]